MAKYKIFVDGSSGTTGLRIADRLAARDEFEILHISEADRKDVNARAAVINQSDLSFLCLPDAACFIFVLEFNFLAFSVAVAMAFSEMSIPVTVDCGMSRLSVMAMQPEPVQMSKMLG